MKPTRLIISTPPASARSAWPAMIAFAARPIARQPARAIIVERVDDGVVGQPRRRLGDHADPAALRADLADAAERELVDVRAGRGRARRGRRRGARPGRAGFPSPARLRCGPCRAGCGRRRGCRRSLRMPGAGGMESEQPGRRGDHRGDRVDRDRDRGVGQRARLGGASGSASPMSRLMRIVGRPSSLIVQWPSRSSPCSAGRRSTGSRAAIPAPPRSSRSSAIRSRRRGRARSGRPWS